MRSFLFLILVLFTGEVYSQLGFCQGSKGSPIFHEDFTSGSLPAGTTSYFRVYGQDPQDGQYNISNVIGRQIGDWHPNLPNTTLSNGNALIVNADEYNAGLFFRREISGLCEAATYEFSAYLMNILSSSRTNCANGGIPINVKFQILDETDTQVLAEGNTGNIQSSNSPFWEQYALTFQTQAGQGKVILKMFNNGVGGCGNDLAIDDIIFRSCGDLTEITSPGTSVSSLEFCPPDVPVSLDLTATPDNSVYSTHAFQWQESSDKITWLDIPGETAANFTSSPLTSTRYFRVKVAENAVNLAGNLCSSVSEPFSIIIFDDPTAPASLGDVQICEGNSPFLEVVVDSDETAKWYDSPTGGVELKTGNTFAPPAQGTYYAEAIKTGSPCAASPRTAVTLTIHPLPQVTDEELQLCSGGSILLDAGAGNFTYNWNNGQTGRQISVSQPGNYSVEITNSNSCSATKLFEVRAVDVAGISKVISRGSSVLIEPANPGDFEFSLDGINFQQSNIFERVPGGIYTAYVRDTEGCNTVSEEFPHIVIPQFITPNNDGFNDSFELKGVEYFSASEIRIFDRYGKLLARGEGTEFSWDGSFSGRDLPTDDYWYHIFIDGFEPVKGYFSLKR